MYDLNSLIANSPLAPYVTLTVATGISNTGFIAANGTDSRAPGVNEVFLLAPVPLPPAALLAALLTEVTGVGPGKSLANKVTAAQAYYAASDTQATCAMLTGFVNEVKAQAGQIGQQLAAKLIVDAQAIEVAIGSN